MDSRFAITLRMAEPGDAPALMAIYAPYVERTAVTFEYAIPSEQEFRSRIASTLAFFPWLVAESGGRPVGYAYAGRFHPRAAYSWCAETSIYLDRAFRGMGFGSILQGCLERILKAQGLLRAYACIAVSEPADEYLGSESMRWHERQGFILAGTFRSCGFKFGRWYDMVWMEKVLAEPAAPPKSVAPLSALGAESLSVLLQPQACGTGGSIRAVGCG